MMRRSLSLVTFVLFASLVSLVGQAWAQTLPVDVPALPELRQTPPRHTTAAPAGKELVGLFAIQAGSCSGSVKGSYFRMVQPGGTTASGPFVSNGDSPCSDDTYTPLSPGSDGGLASGGYQPHPDPTFDGAGNALADRITKPQGFFSVRFSTATNATDPQTNTKVPAPRIYTDAGKLSGDVRAFAAAWNRQHFNQGSPKPDGSKPGNTAGPTGTFDAGTGAFTLEWSSQIVGGPFNNFTGLWRFVGTFRAGAAPADSSGEASVAGASAAASAPAPGASESSTRGGELAVTGGGVSTPVGAALAAVGGLPFVIRRLRRRQRI